MRFPSCVRAGAPFECRIGRGVRPRRRRCTVHPGSLLLFRGIFRNWRCWIPFARAGCPAAGWRVSVCCSKALSSRVRLEDLKRPAAWPPSRWAVLPLCCFSTQKSRTDSHWRPVCRASRRRRSRTRASRFLRTARIRRRGRSERTPIVCSWGFGIGVRGSWRRRPEGSRRSSRWRGWILRWARRTFRGRTCWRRCRRGGGGKARGAVAPRGWCLRWWGPARVWCCSRSCSWGERRRSSWNRGRRWCWSVLGRRRSASRCPFPWSARTVWSRCERAAGSSAAECSTVGPRACTRFYPGWTPASFSGSGCATARTAHPRFPLCTPQPATFHCAKTWGAGTQRTRCRTWRSTDWGSGTARHRTAFFGSRASDAHWAWSPRPPGWCPFAGWMRRRFPLIRRWTWAAIWHSRGRSAWRVLTVCRDRSCRAFSSARGSRSRRGGCRGPAACSPSSGRWICSSRAVFWRSRNGALLVRWAGGTPRRSGSCSGCRDCRVASGGRKRWSPGFRRAGESSRWRNIPRRDRGGCFRSRFLWNCQWFWGRRCWWQRAGWWCSRARWTAFWLRCPRGRCRFLPVRHRTVPPPPRGCPFPSSVSWRSWRSWDGGKW